MSEFTVKGDGESCQKKLAPPRSLQDTGGRGRIVWDMISKRYPKAAPLLCEMETVIDRAQNLLRQLRSVPYDNEIGISNSTQISYNDEFERQRSASSVMESSSSTPEEIDEEVEEVGTRISYDRIPDIEDPSSSTSSVSLHKVEPKESANSMSHVPVLIDVSINTADSETEKKLPKCESDDRSNATSYIGKRDLARTKEVESLEQWDRVVGGKIMNLKSVNVKKEVSIGREDQSGSHESSTIRQTRKSDRPSMEESTSIYEGRGNVETIDDTMRENESARTRKSLKTETALSSKRRAETPSDSSTGRNVTLNRESSLTRKEMEKIEVKEKHKMKSGDVQHSPEKTPSGKTPVEILNEYAEQNSEKVDFKLLQNKGTLLKIKCFFAGHNAEDIGDSKSAVRNKLATKILRKLAEMQIDELDMKNLAPFTDDQMRDIVALDTGDEPENAMRKLYKFCLEKNAPKPIYVVKQRNVAKGFEHVAECRALNNVGHGSAIRNERAKISAAEELYTKLRSEYIP